MTKGILSKDVHQEGEDVIACTYPSVEKAIKEIPKTLFE